AAMKCSTRTKSIRSGSHTDIGAHISNEDQIHIDVVAKMKETDKAFLRKKIKDVVVTVRGSYLLGITPLVHATTTMATSADRQSSPNIFASVVGYCS
nr:hypothetical protein CTI12_AA438750 [Tanacetum cinerariifolium]